MEITQKLESVLVIQKPDGLNDRMWEAISKSISFEIIASAVKSFQTKFDIPFEITKFMEIVVNRSFQLIFSENFKLLTDTIPLPIIQEAMDSFLTEVYSGPIDRRSLLVEFMNEIIETGIRTFYNLTISEDYEKESLSSHSKSTRHNLDELMKAIASFTEEEYQNFLSGAKFLRNRQYKIS